MIRMSRYFDLSQNTVLFVDTLLPIDAFLTFSFTGPVSYDSLRWNDGLGRWPAWTNWRSVLFQRADLCERETPRRKKSITLTSLFLRYFYSSKNHLKWERKRKMNRSKYSSRKKPSLPHFTPPPPFTFGVGWNNWQKCTYSKCVVCKYSRTLNLSPPNQPQIPAPQKQNFVQICWNSSSKLSRFDHWLNVCRNMTSKTLGVNNLCRCQSSLKLCFIYFFSAHSLIWSGACAPRKRGQQLYGEFLPSF